MFGCPSARALLVFTEFVPHNRLNALFRERWESPLPRSLWSSHHDLDSSHTRDADGFKLSRFTSHKERFAGKDAANKFCAFNSFHHCRKTENGLKKTQDTPYFPADPGTIPLMTHRSGNFPLVQSDSSPCHRSALPKPKLRLGSHAKLATPQSQGRILRLRTETMGQKLHLCWRDGDVEQAQFFVKVITFTVVGATIGLTLFG